MLQIPVTRAFALKTLTILLLMFCFRVTAQLLQRLTTIDFLPGFDAWHSASIPYAYLLASQCIIIVLALVVIVNIYNQAYRALLGRSIALLWVDYT